MTAPISHDLHAHIWLVEIDQEGFCNDEAESCNVELVVPRSTCATSSTTSRCIHEENGRGGSRDRASQLLSFQKIRCRLQRSRIQDT